MEEIAISRFKAKCLAILEQVRQSREPLLVTRFGKPVAEIRPPSGGSKRSEWLGVCRGEVTLHGEIIEPLPEEDWEALGP